MKSNQASTNIRATKYNVISRGHAVREELELLAAIKKLQTEAAEVSKYWWYSRIHKKTGGTRAKYFATSKWSHVVQAIGQLKFSLVTSLLAEDSSTFLFLPPLSLTHTQSERLIKKFSGQG